MLFTVACNGQQPDRILIMPQIQPASEITNPNGLDVWLV